MSHDLHRIKMEPKLLVICRPFTSDRRTTRCKLHTICVGLRGQPAANATGEWFASDSALYTTQIIKCHKIFVSCGLRCLGLIVDTNYVRIKVLKTRETFFSLNPKNFIVVSFFHPTPHRIPSPLQIRNLSYSLNSFPLISFFPKSYSILNCSRSLEDILCHCHLLAKTHLFTWCYNLPSCSRKDVMMSRWYTNLSSRQRRKERDDQQWHQKRERLTSTSSCNIKIKKF